MVALVASASPALLLPIATMAMAVQTTAAMRVRAASKAPILRDAMMGMRVPPQTLALKARAKAGRLRIVMIPIYVPMMAVIPARAVFTRRIRWAAMMETAAQPTIPAPAVAAQVLAGWIAMMATCVPTTTVMGVVVVSTRTTVRVVTMLMPVRPQIPARAERV